MEGLVAAPFFKAPRSRGDVLGRAARALETTGWVHLEDFPGDAPREACLIINPDDPDGKVYYLFSTGGFGNGVPPVNITTSSAANPTTVTAPGHYLRAGKQVTIADHSNGNLNGVHTIVSADRDAGTFTLNVLGGGTGGTATGAVDAHTSWRRASTLAGIATASGADKIIGIAEGSWYSHVLREGSGASANWHLWGNNGANSIVHQVMTGLVPDWRGVGLTSVGTSLPVGDISIEQNPTNGLYYAIGNNSTNVYITKRIASLADPQVWTHAVTGVGNTSVSVFTNAGLPPWGGTFLPDPNFWFVDGRCYLGLTGSDDGSSWSSGMVEVDPMTMRAIPPYLVLNQFGSYEAWQQGQILSDLQFRRCPDGIDRIFGFCNSFAFNTTVSLGWGCLELPAA